MTIPTSHHHPDRDEGIIARHALARDPYSDVTPVGGANKVEIREDFQVAPFEKPEVRGDVERGFDVEPIDDLLAQLSATEAEWAHLRALHGPYGKWDNLRKNLLSVVSLRVRQQPPPMGAIKWTDDLTEAAAHADEDYRAFVNNGVIEGAEFWQMDAEREGIWARINRGQALLRTARFT